MVIRVPVGQVAVADDIVLWLKCLDVQRFDLVVAEPCRPEKPSIIDMRPKRAIVRRAKAREGDDLKVAVEDPGKPRPGRGPHVCAKAHDVDRAVVQRVH